MQLEFLWRDGEALRSELEQRSGYAIDLVVTNNRHSMLSVKWPASAAVALRLRLHRMFLTAGPDVVEALAHWLKSPRSKKAGSVINGFIREHTHEITRTKTRSRSLSTQGDVFDLEDIYRRLNAQYFGNSVTAAITWGRMPGAPQKRRRAKRGRCIRFGTYSQAENLIRIHPVLDRPYVPDYFVEFIVYHEMLHAVIEFNKTASGRNAYHTKEFRAREGEFAYYAHAMAWQSDGKNLSYLFRERSK